MIGITEMWILPLVLPTDFLSVLHQPLYLAVVSSFTCEGIGLGPRQGPSVSLKGEVSVRR